MNNVPLKSVLSEYYYGSSDVFIRILGDNHNKDIDELSKKFEIVEKRIERFDRLYKLMNLVKVNRIFDKNVDVSEK